MTIPYLSILVGIICIALFVADPSNLALLFLGGFGIGMATDMIIATIISRRHYSK